MLITASICLWNKTVLCLMFAIPRRPSVSLDDISAVRLGRQSEGLKKNTEEQVEGRCFTIMFKGRRKNLDLIASSDEEAGRWVNSLQKMVSTMNNLNRMEKTEQYPFYDLWRWAALPLLVLSYIATSMVHVPGRKTGLNQRIFVPYIENLPVGSIAA